MRRIVVALLAALLTIALVVSMAATAGAHGELGEITAEVTADADDPTELTVRARIVYVDDGHPVDDDAVVTYLVGGEIMDVAYGSGTMPRVGDGQYEAQVSVPEGASYRVTITSANPEATFETVGTVEATPTTTTAPEADDGGTDDDDVTLSWPVLVGILVFLALVGGVVVVAARQRRV